MIDLRSLTDDEFEEHRAAMMAELERRNNLRDAPAQIKAIAMQYESMGGDKSDLVTVINESHPELVAELPANVPDDTIDEETTNKETNENGTTKGPTSS